MQNICAESLILGQFLILNVVLTMLDATLKWFRVVKMVKKLIKLIAWVFSSPSLKAIWICYSVVCHCNEADMQTDEQNLLRCLDSL